MLMFQLIFAVQNTSPLVLSDPCFCFPARRCTLHQACHIFRAKKREMVFNTFLTGSLIAIFCSMFSMTIWTLVLHLFLDDLVVVHCTSFCFPSLSCTTLEQRTRYPAKCRRHKLQEKSYAATKRAHKLKISSKRREKHPSFSMPCQKGCDSRVFLG